MSLVKKKLALIDIGNSRFKFFYDNSLYSFAYLNSWKNDFKSFLNNLASILIDRGDISEAKKFLKRCLVLLPDFEVAKKNQEAEEITGIALKQIANAIELMAKTDQNAIRGDNRVTFKIRRNNNGLITEIIRETK